jgi:hypothetical protein
MKARRPREPGIGLPATELADAVSAASLHIRLACSRLEGVISGIGDTLLLFANCLEQLGLEPADLRDRLDVLITRLEAQDEIDRAIVPISLWKLLPPPPPPPPQNEGRRALHVVAGGRCDAAHGHRT